MVMNDKTIEIYNMNIQEVISVCCLDMLNAQFNPCTCFKVTFFTNNYICPLYFVGWRIGTAQQSFFRVQSVQEKDKWMWDNFLGGIEWDIGVV